MKKRQLFQILTIALVLLGLFSDGGRAQTPPTPAATPCDPQYFESLKSRAWLEAQREITQNQNLIVKPDSVLQYTCFDRLMNQVTQVSGSMFSGSVGSSLQNLVGNALQTYIRGNFSYPTNPRNASSPLTARLGGGRSGIVYTPGNITAGAYTCDIMRQIWLQAKCVNFILDPSTDGFYTFEEYAGTNIPRDQEDRRLQPLICSTIAPRWADNIETAYVNNAYATLPPNSPPGTRTTGNGGRSTPWTEDDLVTFINRLDPANCTDNGANNSINRTYPIESGIKIARPAQRPNFYDEKICIAPGCYYEPDPARRPANSNGCVRP